MCTKPVDSVFARSDWLLKLGTVSADSPPGISLDFAREFSLISQKKLKALFGTGCPLGCYMLK